MAPDSGGRGLTPSKSAEAGTTEGTFSPGNMIVTGLTGTSIFKLSLWYNF